MIVDGWLDWAERKDGIPDKVYSQPNAGDGIACHSQEGYRNSIESRFFCTERLPNGRYTEYCAASAMFYNPLTGPLVQYYQVTKSTWTSGNYAANTTLWAVESEGMVPDLLNDNQVANMLRLAQEWEAYTGVVASRMSAIRTVWEHKEVWDWSEPTAGPTACPSGRYQPFYDALEGAMTPEEKKLFDAVVKLVAGTPDDVFAAAALVGAGDDDPAADKGSHAWHINRLNSDTEWHGILHQAASDHVANYPGEGPLAPFDATITPKEV